MNVCYGNLFSAISSMFAASIIVMLMISGRFRSFTSFSASTLQYSVPIQVIQLNRNITISDRVQTIHSVSSSLSFQRNRTIIGMIGDLMISLAQYARLICDHTHERKFAKDIRREEELEQGLALARASIRRAASGLNLSSIAGGHNKIDIDSTSIYHNARAFYRSYLEMERRFKVYVYSEGELPIVHDGPCKDIYTIEGRFIHELEHGASRFKTNNPHSALVYFMPFSVTWMVKYLYKPLSYDHTPLRQFVSDYVRVVSSKYPFWNRTQGADHFMLACHDWGPHASQGNPDLYSKSIRVLCNANTSEGFNPQKDVSLPEIHLYGGEVSPKILSPQPGAADSPRLHLAFFAGGLHGPIRPLLLQHWKDIDPELHVHEYLPKDLDYYSLMLQSKFCLCPSGYEVASPRIVEAIYAECVPVILSQNYVLPFSDVLRWEAFSIRVDVSEIPRLKEVLTAVSEEKYRRLKEGLRAVRKHFVLNQPSKPFDVFHMILHSVWLRRINLRRQQI